MTVSSSFHSNVGTYAMVWPTPFLIVFVRQPLAKSDTPQTATLLGSWVFAVSPLAVSQVAHGWSYQTRISHNHLIDGLIDIHKTTSVMYTKFSLTLKKRVHFPHYSASHTSAAVFPVVPTSSSGLHLSHCYQLQLHFTLGYHTKMKYSI